MTLSSSHRVATMIWRGRFSAGHRAIPEEMPIALSYNRLTHAVMMATPADLQDFAIGFSRSERIIARADDIEEFEIVDAEAGIECRMWIRPALLDRLDERRRSLAGPTGCGLCGLESLAQAVQPSPIVGAGLQVDPAEIKAAMEAMPALQTLNAETRAVHAAGFWCRDRGLFALREDVGRHNALDKLSGALARGGEDGSNGMIVMTSRISLELVQKAAVLGATILVAVSAPTRRALDVAEQVGMTLIGVARRDGFEIFTRPDRVVGAVTSQR